MTEPQHTASAQYAERVERRIQFLKTLKDAGLGVFLPADEGARKLAFEQLARMTARQRELPHLSPADLAKATEAFRVHLDAMQGVLPHDVQYKNRIRRNW
ncbi:hypothetical protein J5J83_18405 [Azoarcus sp. L1K30]|uniref:hypothetical protein n=1 Tax=Azoarcus sp. L1K30 TaxID=2820277 RepID=UPI001B81B15B|nr:hypothetical protein [Azoarcus sp. L1K30]MBR0568095.1 hypothetical protein [Azoarcus sp. L1K30]